MLYLVATPIGNLEDITLRSLRILKEVELICAEDTRKTRTLLAHFGIRNHLLSFHDHNKKMRTQKIIQLLKEGRDIALVTSAGTPGISDPGFYLIRACARGNLPITSVPGPSAVTNALLLSGLATDAFFFAGFLSPKTGRRKKMLKELAAIKTTIVIFESCHRLNKTLECAREFFGGKQVAVVREMTKIHEEVVRGEANDVYRHTLSFPPKGECVLVVDNR